MSTKSMLHQAKLNEWASRFADQKSSGLSVPAWCEQQGISKYKFFYWKKLLKEEAVSQMLPDIIPLSIPSNDEFKDSSQPPAAIELTRATCATRATSTTMIQNSIARIYINGITIEFDSNASEAFIHTLIKAVRHA